MMKVLANTKLVIIFLHRNVSNQLVVHLKFIQCYISILYLQKNFFKDTHKENDSKRLDLNVKPKTIKLLDNRIKP